jgi:AbiU2
MAAFVDELELFRTEEEVAQQYFFCYLSVRSLASAAPEVLKAMNTAPLFWITTHHAMLLSAFVALGRIFDQDHKSMHNIDKLIKAVADDLPAFTRAALAVRKQAAGVLAEDAAAYVYEARYRDIRHGVFAHKGLDRAGSDALMAKTNVEEMKSLLGFLHVLYETLWEAYFNGRKPDLTIREFVLPPDPPVGSMKPGERVFREGHTVLTRLSQSSTKL